MPVIDAHARGAAAQPGILAGAPSRGRYLFFDLSVDATAQALRETLGRIDVRVHVVGLGGAALDRLGLAPGAMRAPPAWTSHRGYAVWVLLRGDDAGSLAREGIRLAEAAAGVLRLIDAVDGFEHAGGRDLTGYVDGTENPEGDAAVAAALDLSGGSYVAVRRWRHNFRVWDTLTTDQQDAVIGRRISDNEEIDDAPESAHFKRTAQESFEPEAFILRRSMPYAAGPDAGLMFVAFGCSYAAFEAQLGRMYGRDDGIQDGLMAISDPLELAYFWGPPLVNGTLGL